jgi:hypothetical protein
MKGKHMPAMEMRHEKDPKDVLLESLGNLDAIELFNNQVLLAVYQRPKDAVTKGGLHLPQSVTDEDKYQSKVGLLIKAGPAAFTDSKGEWFAGASFVKCEDWLIFRPSDGWGITVNKVLCRMVLDVNIRGRIDHPDNVW